MKWFWLAALVVCLCMFGLVHVAAALLVIWFVCAIMA
jgi:hypothetical protein